MAYWEFESTAEKYGRFRQLRVRDKGAVAALGDHYLRFRESRFVTDDKTVADYLRRGIKDGSIPAVRETVRNLTRVRCEFCDRRFDTKEFADEHALAAHGDELDAMRERVQTKPVPKGTQYPQQPLQGKTVSRGVQTVHDLATPTPKET